MTAKEKLRRMNKENEKPRPVYVNEVATFIGVELVGSIPNIMARRFDEIPGFVRSVYDHEMGNTYLIFEPTYLTEHGVRREVAKALKGEIKWRDIKV